MNVRVRVGGGLRSAALLHLDLGVLIFLFLPAPTRASALVFALTFAVAAAAAAARGHARICFFLPTAFQAAILLILDAGPAADLPQPLKGQVADAELLGAADAQGDALCDAVRELEVLADGVEEGIVRDLLRGRRVRAIVGLREGSGDRGGDGGARGMKRGGDAGRLWRQVRRTCGIGSQGGCIGVDARGGLAGDGEREGKCLRVGSGEGGRVALERDGGDGAKGAHGEMLCAEDGGWVEGERSGGLVAAAGEDGSGGRGGAVVVVVFEREGGRVDEVASVAPDGLEAALEPYELAIVGVGRGRLGGVGCGIWLCALEAEFAEQAEDVAAVWDEGGVRVVYEDAACGAPLGELAAGGGGGEHVCEAGGGVEGAF